MSVIPVMIPRIRTSPIATTKRTITVTIKQIWTLMLSALTAIIILIVCLLWSRILSSRNIIKPGTLRTSQTTPQIFIAPTRNTPLMINIMKSPIPIPQHVAAGRLIPNITFTIRILITSVLRSPWTRTPLIRSPSTTNILIALTPIIHAILFSLKPIPIFRQLPSTRPT